MPPPAYPVSEQALAPVIETPVAAVEEVRLCLDCEKQIPQKRLDAVPDALRCVKCQPDYDRKREADELYDPETMREMARNILGSWGAE
jgi:phage/conjugal plasmid C-4 type zinc finger TraR family protein